MRLNLDDGRLNPRRFKNVDDVFHVTVGQSYRPAFTLINEVFQCAPGFQESDAFVVYHVTIGIPWILIIPWFECERSVNEIKIEIDDPQSFHARLTSRLNALWPVIGIPKFGRDE